MLGHLNYTPEMSMINGKPGLEISYSLKRGWQYDIFATTGRNISKNVSLILEEILYEK